MSPCFFKKCQNFSGDYYKRQNISDLLLFFLSKEGLLASHCINLLDTPQFMLTKWLVWNQVLYSLYHLYNSCSWISPDPDPADGISNEDSQSSSLLSYNISPQIQNKMGVEELHPAAQLIIKHAQKDVCGQTW